MTKYQMIIIFLQIFILNEKLLADEDVNKNISTLQNKVCTYDGPNCFNAVAFSQGWTQEIRYFSEEEFLLYLHKTSILTAQNLTLKQMLAFKAPSITSNNYIVVGKDYEGIAHTGILLDNNLFFHKPGSFSDSNWEKIDVSDADWSEVESFDLYKVRYKISPKPQSKLYKLFTHNKELAEKVIPCLNISKHEPEYQSWLDQKTALILGRALKNNENNRPLNLE